MKTTKSILLILALAAAVSCVKEENPQQENEAIEFGQFSFTAVRENVGDNTPSSKSQLDPNDTDDTDGRMVHWKSGDAVIVFEASDENNIVTGSNLPTDEGNWYKGYKFATEGAGLTADFTITADDKKGASEDSFNPAAGKYIMLYTYSETYYCNVEKSFARFYISPSQTATKNSFDKNRGSAIAKASSLEENVSFKNLVSLLKFTVPEEFSGKVASIAVSGNGTEHIAGDVFVDFSSAEPVLQAWHAKYGNTTARYSVTLSDADGMEQGDYYIAVLPTTVSEVNVTVTMTDGQIYTRSKVGEYEFKRNTIHYMGAISDAYAHLTATACETTSSTASFTWTCGTSVADDVARDYKLYLYDADDNLVVSYLVPHNYYDYSKVSDLWKDMQPKWVFGGLAQNTAYKFKVTDINNNLISNVVTCTTTTFENVTVPASDAKVGEVILAEDFAEIVGGAETVAGAAGATKKSAMEAMTGECEAVDANLVYRAFSSDANGSTKNETFRSALAATSRLKDWAYYRNNGTTYMFGHCGYFKLGSGSYTTSIVTPELTAIPDGSTATLEVKVTMARKADDRQSELHMAVSSMKGTRQDDLHMDNVTINGTSDSQQLTNYGKWEKYTFTIDGVEKGDRLNITPVAGKYTNGKAVHYINDVTVTVKALTPVAE
ncbi:MAG: hypothetical protein J6A91_08385 [Bacteroidales bacterium]|nr:hypothetical protein [Bacteroidales bacterium]